MNRLERAGRSHSPLPSTLKHAIMASGDKGADSYKWGWALARSHDSSRSSSAGKAPGHGPLLQSRPKSSGAARSRSPGIRGCGALRADAPGRAAPKRGALPDLSSSESRVLALEELQRDFVSASGRGPAESRLRTVQHMLGLWGLHPLPPTQQHVLALGATLKKGGYRSPEQYLSTYKVWAERQGFAFDAPTLRALADAKRSATRGIGGSIKTMGLPLHLLGELPGSRTSWTPSGPLSPRNAKVAGAWFMTRELELSCARAAMVTFDLSSGSPVARWHLPASKTDAKAEGVARSHGCACGDGPPNPACPAHALWDQRIFLKRTFPDRWVGDTPDWSLPLFPSASGAVCTKAAMAATIMKAAELLKSPLSSPDGSERITGHTLRATGAQGLARLGIDLWAIQLMGRWGSDVVRRYVREVALESAASWASSAASSSRSAMPKPTPEDSKALGSCALDLEQVVADLSELASSRLEKRIEELVDKFSVAGPVRELAAPLREEVLLPPPPPPQPAAGAGLPEGDSYLVNEQSGVVHRVPGSLSGSLDGWTTACGWRFAKQSNAKLLADAFRHSHKSVCEKCLPALRAERKAGGTPS